VPLTQISELNELRARLVPLGKIDDDRRPVGSATGQTRIDPAAIIGRRSAKSSSCRQLGNEVLPQILHIRHRGTSHNWESVVPSFDHFQLELRAQFDRAEKRRAKNIVVNSGEFHGAVGGCPGPNERLQTCRDVIKEEVRSGDVIMGDLDNCRGAALTIRYQLPRVEKFVVATGAHPDTDSLVNREPIARTEISETCSSRA
jgi:hypothetical protein